MTGAVMGAQPFVRGVAIEGAMRPVVIVVVLPLPEFLVKQAGVVLNDTLK